MTGAASAISHGGFRSELLAQYAFTAWGTSIPTPNPQDHGIDLHCTLTEEVGKRLWAKSPYTVQVKSNMDPWTFDGKESVRWLIEHPLPLFLCVVERSSARLRVYHTSPRFWAWAFGGEWDFLCLRPSQEVEGERIRWKDGREFSLSAPILDFCIGHLSNDDFCQNARQTLEEWISFDRANLTRVQTGIVKFVVPLNYTPNVPPSPHTTAHYSKTHEQVTSEEFQKALPSLRETLDFVGGEFHKRGEVEAAAKVLLLHRHLFPDKLHPYLNEIDKTLALVEDSCLHVGIERLEKAVHECVSEVDNRK